MPPSEASHSVSAGFKRYGARLPLLALFAANTVSLIGNRLSDLVIPWFVLETTGSAGKTGLIGAVITVPLILSAFFGGALVDRVGFRTTSVVADVASGLTVALIPLLHMTVGLEFWQLLVLVFLGAILDSPGHVARQSLFPDLVELAGIRLERANAASQVIWRLSWLLGPPLAGMLIALLGTSNVLWLDAGSFAVSALLIGLAVPATRSRASREPSPSVRGYLSELAVGITVILRDRLILLLETAATLGNALGAALFAVGLPIYALRTFNDATALGLLLGGFGGGALVGAVIFGVVESRVSQRRLFIGAQLAGIIPYWILAFEPSLELGITATVLAGLASGPFGPIIMAVFQRRVPADVRGRFFGAAYALDNATTPLVVLLAGLLSEVFTLGMMLALVATVNLAVTVAVVTRPVLRELDAPHRSA